MATATLLPMARAVFYNPNGAPLAGGFVNTYIASTTTPKTTWQDAAETTPNANPIVLDSGGSCLLYGTGAYTLAVTDATGNSVPAYSGLTGSTVTTTSDLTYTPAWTGGVTRTVTARLMDYISVMDFGATGNGTTDDTAAITAVFLIADDIFFPPGTYRVTSNILIPSGKTAHIVGGAMLAPDGGVTITINGVVDAPIQQIFSGSGSVVGLRQVYPEWWGALGNGTGNDQPALQAAWTCVNGSLASDGGRPTIFLTRPTYQVATTWTVAPSANINLAVQGNGTIFSGVRIVAASTFSPAGPVVLIDGSTDPIQGIADWRFCDVGIVASAGGFGAANAGLQVGSASPSKTLIGQQESIVENVFISGIPNGLTVIHTRLVQFNRVSVWNNTLASANNCINLFQNGGFTGDLTFNDCQFVSQIGANHIGLSILSTVAGSGFGVAGIRFNGLIGYTCGNYVDISCQAGTRVGDIWFNPGSQFDGGSNSAVLINCIGAGSIISDIHFDGVFIDGATADMITVTTAAGNNVQNLWVTDCWLSQATSRTVVVGGTGLTTGLHIHNNAIDSCTAAAGAIVISNVTGAEITGNVLTRSFVQTCGFVATLGAGCDYLVVTSNNGSGIPTSGIIQDLSGGINKSVANNI